jgi:hypothetical protein
MTRPHAPAEVLVYSEFADESYLDLTVKGAHMVHWRALAFSNFEMALEEFEGTPNAFITTHSRGWPKVDSASDRLLAIANEIDIPHAILSNRPEALKDVRPNRPDTVIAIEPKGDIPILVAAWLLSLSVDHD